MKYSEDNHKEVYCSYCGASFKKYHKQVYKTNFCNRNCKKLFQTGKTLEELHGDEKAKIMKERLVEVMTGSNNPNFNNKWSDDQKAAQSEKITKTLNSMGELERKEKFGKSNRGLIRSQEFIDNWHSTWKQDDYKKPPISEDTRNKIAVASANKFKKEGFADKFRQTMENNGSWIPLEQKTDYEIYFAESNWVARMWDLVDCDKQQQLLSSVGVFNYTSNSRGVVRDHIYCRRDGFNNKVFPEILRHPCNCQILTQMDNVRKQQSSTIDSSWLTLEELFDKIESYTGIWTEHNLVLQLIQQYKEGNRWERQQ